MAHTIKLLLGFFFAFWLWPKVSWTQNDSIRIDSLDFPYKMGYNMKFNSYITFWGSALGGNAGVKTESEGEFIYEIKEQQFDGKDTVVIFYATTIFREDTQIIQSPLYINDEGMFFYYSVEYLNVAAGNTKFDKRNEYVFQTIKTPLFEGMTWQSFDYSLQMNTFTCFTVDSIIETPAGEFHAFGIRTETSSVEMKNELKGFTKETRVVTYYSQGIGKIYEIQYMYFFNKKTGEFIDQAKVEVVLNEIWWNE